MEDNAVAPEAKADRLRVSLGICLVAVISLLAAGLMLTESSLINGVSYWRWSYQPDPVGLGWIVIVATLVTALGAAAWRIHLGGHISLSLLLVTAAAMLLRLSTAWFFTHDVSLRYVDYVVRNPVVGGYFTVAERLEGHDAMLARYPRGMPYMPPHAMNKPPGPALFNLLFIRLLGNRLEQQTAGIVGLACGVLSLASIPLIYGFVRALGGSTRAGFHAAALWALCPGATIFFALFDPLLTVPVLLLAITWTIATRDDRCCWSAAMGVVLALVLFCTFNVLPIGVFLAAIGFGAAPGTFVARLKRFARHAGVVFGVAIVLHGAFALCTGFSLHATFLAALDNQARLLKDIPRPYPATIGGDLVDFALGVAWIPFALATLYLTRVRRPMTLTLFAVVAGLLQLLLMAISALLPGETSRVWNFLIPLILLPAALELERWPRWLPTLAYAAMATLTALLARSMVFMLSG